ncbi:MAG: hypothetical protein KIS94_03525 [Chitinophagales bacterium]|nr:hypothetical protein [Chitinophagales bacterium]
MQLKHLINKVLITLEADDKTTLFILLAKDGSIHRKGNGSAEAGLPLATGFSADGHFDALMLTVNENIFEYSGVMKMPERKGRECRLTLIFQGADEVDFSYRVVYGDQSEGPPAELVQILINAVKITDGWYFEQISEEVADKGKWWQFWK